MEFDHARSTVWIFWHPTLAMVVACLGTILMDSNIRGDRRAIARHRALHSRTDGYYYPGFILFVNDSTYADKPILYVTWMRILVLFCLFLIPPGTLVPGTVGAIIQVCHRAYHTCTRTRCSIKMSRLIIIRMLERKQHENRRPHFIPLHCYRKKENSFSISFKNTSNILK